MKAVLEFKWPEDEEKFRHSYFGSNAISGLRDVQQMIRQWEKHDGENPVGLIDLIKDTVAMSLRDCMEE